MKPLRGIVVVPVLLLAATLTAVAPPQESPLPQPWQHWRYSTPIDVPPLVEAQLVRVVVPERVSRVALASLSDLRVIDDAGREVPFVLHARTGRVVRERRGGRVIDQTYAPGEDTRATVDLGDDPPLHNGVQLETSLEEFFRRVAVDVSVDGRTWRVAQEGAPVYRFTRHDLAGNQEVHYPDSRARYVRVRITDDSERFPLTGVRVWHEVREEAELAPVDLALRPDPGASDGESWWVLERESPGQPLAQVRFAVAQETFHRPVRVRTSDDGAAWRTVGTGDIYRMESGSEAMERLHVDFSETRAGFLRIEVVNRSDPPLAGVTPTPYATPRHVVLRAEPGRSYRLLYGNPRATAPQYEMVRLTSAADLEAAPSAELGGESVNPAFVDPAPWTERHPAVLWGALIAAVAVLGLLAIRSLRESGQVGTSH